MTPQEIITEAKRKVCIKHNKPEYFAYQVQDEITLEAVKIALSIDSVSGSAYICQNVNGEEAIVFGDNIAKVFDKLEEICPDSSDVKVAGKSTPHYR